jgi:hypothetical protein
MDERRRIFEPKVTEVLSKIAGDNESTYEVLVLAKAVLTLTRELEATDRALAASDRYAERLEERIADLETRVIPEPPRLESPYQPRRVPHG